MIDPTIKDRLVLLAPECCSFRSLTKRLGKAPVGSNIQQTQRQCVRYNIDTTHFLGKSSARGKQSAKRMSADEVLVCGIYTDGRREAYQLRRALLEIGVEYKCSECETVEWQGKPLTLDIDHIDGQFWNNVRENLRFVCPNCHRQTDTYGAKNIGNVA
jgi:hypothetical protein